MDARQLDSQVRTAAFSFLEAAVVKYGDVVPWATLTKEFVFSGTLVPLIGASGIWKPRVLPEMPISISTAPPHASRPPPYQDGLDAEGRLSYRYRGQDPDHRDNVALRAAMVRAVPLIYFYGVTKGHYLPVWPVYVVHDDPTLLTFSVAVDEKNVSVPDVAGFPDYVSDGRRAYVTRLTVHRLHQATFRERVLRAYRSQCAICRLRHTELLDAAHILPDSDPRGEPVVSNGLSLCKLHHAAYDRQVLGVRPDLIVEVRKDILEEEDGPMLRYGLQEVSGVRLYVPASLSQRPRTDFLEERYRLFREAS